MELWDAYDKDGNLLDFKLVRGEEIAAGVYHIVCEALVRHPDGDFLLMKRAMSKEAYPGFYEATCGGRTVLTVSKELLTWGDTYVLRYSNPADEMPGLLLVIAIDAANCDKN